MFDNPFKRKSDEEEKRKEGRLPPGQSLTNKFPVLHYGPGAALQPVDLVIQGVGRGGAAG